LINEVRLNFQKSNSFKKRMQFVYMCEDLLMKKDIFETQFKSDFLKLALDHVVDVRLALAKVLRSHFNEIEGPFVFDKDINMAVRLLQ